MRILQTGTGGLLLGGAPDDTALLTADTVLTYAQVAAAVEERRAALGAERRLVLLEAGNDVETVVTYLAALAGHHPVLLAPPGADHTELVRRYGPEVLATASGVRRLPAAGPGSEQTLHPDLALLLSTSGSTGSPKLVRLSRANLAANAASIADYLGIRPTDRAMTSLPLHYCYGLSVLNSHLLSGAAVVLTDLSVADECFWDLATEVGATTFPGVPYTFDLLDSSGFAERELPSLRYLTQAGGKLPPAQVRRFAELGRERGWDLFVMYGQTEATARMAYLPPGLAAERPEAIGVPIPGGDFRLEPVEGAEPGVGELVYTGPNVMMGYAEHRADLARGAETSELRTGDLARQADDGLWEITGRRSRFGKVFGLRLDLDRIEERAGAAAAVQVRAVAPGARLHLFLSDGDPSDPGDPGDSTDAAGTADVASATAATLAGVPAGAVRAHRVATIPRTASGKVDYALLNAWAREDDGAGGAAEAVAGPGAGAGPEALRALFATVLGRPHAGLDDSFVSLGGDSLSFVEIATQLGDRLGTLPSGWQHRTIAELAAAARPRRRWLTPVETPALLRALAIVAVVGSHADVWQLLGGAHLLLAVTGYNLARFAGRAPTRRLRTRRLLGAAASVAVPAAAWIGAVAVLTGDYRWSTALGLNQLLGSDRWSDDWQFWFLEAVAWSVLAVAGLLAVPVLDRWQRRHRFPAAVVGLAAACGLRYGWVGVEAGPTERYSVGGVAWCLALGWLAAEARTPRQRVTVAVLGAVVAYGFFGDTARELVVVLGVLALLVPWPVLVPRTLARAVAVVGGASLWIYLTHWQVYPGLEDAGHGWLAVGASLLVGVLAGWAYTRTARALRPLAVRCSPARGVGVRPLR